MYLHNTRWIRLSVFLSQPDTTSGLRPQNHPSTLGYCLPSPTGTGNAYGNHYIHAQVHANSSPVTTLNTAYLSQATATN